jgi:hypothetical protein
MPTVSVVIPCYNHARFLADAIASALCQTRPPEEVIVIDDGSTDDTPSVVRRFEHRISYLRQDNRGLAAARNAGIRRARGELIALLDSDDLWLPTFLQVMMPVIADHPGAALYYSAWQPMDVDGQEVATWGPSRHAPPAEVYATLLRADFLVPSAVILRRTAVLDAGLFDESLRSQEDWDLWLRLARRWPVVGTAAPLVRYRITPGSMSTDVGAAMEAVFRIVDKHLGPDHGSPATWSTAKRRAYGGGHRFCAIASLKRAGDRAACARHLRRALEVDPTLATDLDLFFELAVVGQTPGERGRFDRVDLTSAAATLSSILDATFDRGSTGPSPESVRRRAHATASFALGLVAYGCGRTAEARRFLGRAVGYVPGLALQRRFLGTFARACAGRRLMDALRRWRRVAGESG